MGNFGPTPAPTLARAPSAGARRFRQRARSQQPVGWLAPSSGQPRPRRIELVCTWALSEDRDERLALARALTWSTPFSW